MWDSMLSRTPGPLQSLNVAAPATQGELLHKAHRSLWGPPRTPLPWEDHKDSPLSPQQDTAGPAPRKQEPQDSPLRPQPGPRSMHGIPSPPQASAQHFRTPTVPSAPSTAPPAPIPCSTHIVECVTKPLLLQLVERGVEEAQGCQLPLQAPVIDQCHHACHHRCGRLRGHNPSAQDTHHPGGQQGMSSLPRSLTPRAVGCGLSPPSSCQRARPGRGMRGRCC